MVLLLDFGITLGTHFYRKPSDFWLLPLVSKTMQLKIWEGDSSYTKKEYSQSSNWLLNVPHITLKKQSTRV
jgi:hypothetical protein